MTPQAATVLQHLQNHGSLTPAEASTVYRVRSLSRRICDLKDAGYKIHRELKADATGQRYASYTLIVKKLAGKDMKVGQKVRIIPSEDSISAGSCYFVGDEGVIVIPGVDMQVEFQARSGYAYYVDPSEVEAI